MKKRIFVCVLLFFISILSLYFLFFPKKYYTDKDFNITFNESNIDYDNDGIWDYTDIYEGAITYIKTKPKYKSKYYSGGYPNDNYGVCTDVIWKALNSAGYKLKDMIDEDILNNRELYNIEKPDPNIDFRRVKNLKIFMDRNITSLTTNTSEISKWQKGDIVVFEKHIAIISEKRNKKGIPYIVHNSGNGRYEEDALLKYEIIGHYRWEKLSPDFSD